MSHNCFEEVRKHLLKRKQQVENELQYLRAKMEEAKKGKQQTPAGKRRTALINIWEIDHGVLTINEG